MLESLVTGCHKRLGPNDSRIGKIARPVFKTCGSIQIKRVFPLFFQNLPIDPSPFAGIDRPGFIHKPAEQVNSEQKAGILLRTLYCLHFMLQLIHI